MDDFIPILALSIPVIISILGVVLGMFALYLPYRRRREMFLLVHQERMAALDKGIELPPLPEALFAEAPRSRSPHRTLLTGLILLFTGLAAFIALRRTAYDAASFALIPAGVGIAFLIYYLAVGRKEGVLQEASRVLPPPKISPQTT